jgi:hypothetical protein
MIRDVDDIDAVRDGDLAAGAFAVGKRGNLARRGKGAESRRGGAA